MRDDGAFATPSSSPELGNFPGPFQQRLSSECLHSIPKTSFFRGEFLYGTYGRCVILVSSSRTLLGACYP